MAQDFDFSGYATKNGLKCTDGKTIIKDAFKHNDQQKVPLVWQHQHDAVNNILGHVYLENRTEGVYAYGFFNKTPQADIARELVKHGDISAMSIYANQLIQRGDDVVHGTIREVSLVMSGANPQAFIDTVNLQHSSTTDSEQEAIIYTGLELAHSDEGRATMANTEEKTIQDVLNSMNDEQTTALEYLVGEALAHADGADEEDEDEDEGGDETIKDVFDSMTKEQKDVVYYMIGEALGGDAEAKDKAADSKVPAELKQSDQSSYLRHSQEGSPMSRNVFDQNGQKSGRATLSHSQIDTIVQDGIKMGSFKESFLSHAADYGITNIELMFPDAKALANAPELLARQAEWVPKVLGATKHAPFAKIKSLVADLTAAEARAKGYIKGNEKTEEVIKLLRRTTGPTTVYKKQKLDRDDVLDITDFDVIAWLKWEIRFMLDEELARAILIGDGRSSISTDKIKDPEGAVDGTGIRSIANDNVLYAHRVQLEANVSSADMIDAITRSRTSYRGSGTPTLYTTDKIITDLLVLKDKMGRRLYETEAALAATLRVKEIVPVEVLEESPDIVGIIVNLVDYTVGANKGGEVSFFEDFDIDFNQNKYLMETRISGALTKPKSAIVIRRALGTAASVSAPSFDGGTNTITVPTAAGVQYLINDSVVTGNVVITEDTEIVAAATSGYYIPANSTTNWTFTFTEI